MIPIVAGAVVAIVAVIMFVGLVVWKSKSGKSRELGVESGSCRRGLDPLGNAHVLT